MRETEKDMILQLIIEMLSKKKNVHNYQMTWTHHLWVWSWDIISLTTFYSKLCLRPRIHLPSEDSRVFLSQHLRLQRSSLLNVYLNCKLEISLLSSYSFFSLFNQTRHFQDTEASIQDTMATKSTASLFIKDFTQWACTPKGTHFNEKV